MNFQLDATVAHAQMSEEIQCGNAGGVFFWDFWQLAVIASDFCDAQAGFFRVACYNFIPRGIDSKAKHVKSAGDIGDSCWCKYANFLVSINVHDSIKIKL